MTVKTCNRTTCSNTEELGEHPELFTCAFLDLSQALAETRAALKQLAETFAKHLLAIRHH